MSGRVGRPALHPNVHVLRGNASKKPMSALLEEFSPEAALPKVPAWVKGEARKEYQRLGVELERYRVISELDRGVLTLCACEWAKIVWLEKKISDANDADPNGEAGMVARTPNGFRVMSVEIQLLRATQAMYLKLVSELGCSPSSRSRIKPSDAQMPLPGIEPEPGEPAVGRPSLASFA